MGLLNHGQTTNARANDTGYARGKFLIQGFANWQTRVLYSLHSCRNTVVDESVHGARFFGTNVLLQIEALNLSGNSARER
jgi:hypothetical protein